jgi:hypothetical protein
MSENDEKDEKNEETEQEEEEELYPKEFEKVINDLYKDISLTFPEIKLKEITKEADYLELYEYCKLIYPKHFFNILYKNEEMFKVKEDVDTTDNDNNTNFLPNVDFKVLWNSNITDKTRDIIWKYLQLVLFLVVNSGNSENMFGEATEIFKAIDQEDFKSKLKETIGEMNNMFNQEEDSSGVDIPSADDMHSHINGLLDGKLGALAKEIAEETSKDLKHSIDESSSADEVFQTLIKDPTRLMKLIKTIGTKLDDKFKSGEIKESELLEEATEMLNKMKKVPGMKNIDEMLKKMGMPGGVGNMAAGSKIDLGAMKNNLNKNLKNAKMRERMLKKLEEKKKENEIQKIIDNAVVIDNKFSTGEIIEKTPVPKEKNKNKKKKKNKNKKK